MEPLPESHPSLKGRSIFFDGRGRFHFEEGRTSIETSNKWFKQTTCGTCGHIEREPYEVAVILEEDVQKYTTDNDVLVQLLGKHDDCGRNGCLADGRKEEDGMICSIVISEDLEKLVMKGAD